MFRWNTLKASRGRETLNIRSPSSNSLSRHEIWGLLGSQNSSCDLVGFHTMQSCKWKCWFSPARLRRMKIQKTAVSALTLTLVKCEPTYEVYWNTSKSLSAVRCPYSVYVHIVVPWPMMSLSSHCILYLPFAVSNCARISKQKLHTHRHTHTHTHTCENYSGS